MLTLFTLLVMMSNTNHSTNVLSAPVPGRQDTTHWVSAPTTRGTFGLLVSCVLTLILCLWTSLHLNLSRKDETAMGRVSHKLKWTLLALFAPEIIVYTAWRQYVSAQALSTEVNDVLKVRFFIPKPLNMHPRGSS
jgi:hypothetical protein